MKEGVADRRHHAALQHPHLLIQRVLNLFYRITDCSDLLCYLGRYLDIEFLFDTHDDLEYIQGICT
jgi:hypothetical protein